MLALIMNKVFNVSLNFWEENDVGLDVDLLIVSQLSSV